MTVSLFPPHQGIGPDPEVWQDGAQTVVSVRGEQDLSTAVEFDRALTTARSTGDGDVLVDLSEVQFIDAAIVRLLINHRNELHAQSRDLTLHAPSQPARRILMLCKIIEVPPSNTG